MHIFIPPFITTSISINRELILLRSQRIHSSDSLPGRLKSREAGSYTSVAKVISENYDYLTYPNQSYLVRVEGIGIL
jgi:hypothetical protein